MAATATAAAAACELFFQHCSSNYATYYYNKNQHAHDHHDLLLLNRKIKPTQISTQWACWKAGQEDILHLLFRQYDWCTSCCPLTTWDHKSLAWYKTSIDCCHVNFSNNLQVNPTCRSQPYNYTAHGSQPYAESLSITNSLRIGKSCSHLFITDTYVVFTAANRHVRIVLLQKVENICKYKRKPWISTLEWTTSARHLW